MRNILFISTYPFPIDKGSKQHAYCFIKALAVRYNIYCIFFIPPHKEAPSSVETDIVGLDIKAYDLCYFETSISTNKYNQLMKRIASFPSSYINLATHSNSLLTINSFIEKYAIDIVHFEHFWFTKYAFQLSSNFKKVIVYHDLHHNIYKQLAKFESKFHRKLLYLMEWLKFFIYEHLLDKYISMKIFLNPLEMKALPKNSVHIPHIVNSDILYKPPRNTDFFNILFIGAFNHPPNRRSVEFIINRILPRLVQTHRNFKLHIVGPGTEKFAELVDRSLHRDDVVLHGFKRDINDAFENMDIALFPIIDGGGIKTKIIDALASGVPVVTTPKGIEGLDRVPSNCIGVGDTTQEIVKHMLKLMKSFSLRLDRSKKGRDFIDREHSFKAFSEKMIPIYSKLEQI